MLRVHSALILIASMVVASGLIIWMSAASRWVREADRPCSADVDAGVQDLEEVRRELHELRNTIDVCRRRIAKLALSIRALARAQGREPPRTLEEEAEYLGIPEKPYLGPIEDTDR